MYAKIPAPTIREPKIVHAVPSASAEEEEEEEEDGVAGGVSPDAGEDEGGGIMLHDANLFTTYLRR